MAEKLSVKSNALSVLKKQLYNRAIKRQHGFVALGSATDAYMPQEEELRLTEGMLKLLLQYRFPVFISTKRDLITRDLDILKQIDSNAILPFDLKEQFNRGLILSVSISTMDKTISNILEPGACSPNERMQLVQQLKKEGFVVGVNAIPVLPFISDTEEELRKIISAAVAHQADYILIGGLTLFGNGSADSKTLYYKFLQLRYPLLIPRYDQLFNGNFYIPNSYHISLKKKANAICKEYGIRTGILF